MRNLARLYTAGLAAVVVMGGVRAGLGQAGPAGGATVAATAPAAAASLKQLQAERLKCAQAVLEAALAKLNVGAGTMAEVSAARRLVLEAQLDMAQTKAQRVAIAQELVATCEAQVKDAQARVSVARIGPGEMAYANYDLASARVVLAQIQAAP